MADEKKSATQSYFDKAKTVSSVPDTHEVDAFGRLRPKAEPKKPDPKPDPKAELPKSPPVDPDAGGKKK